MNVCKHPKEQREHLDACVSRCKLCDTIIVANTTALSAVNMALRTGGGNSETAYVQSVESYFLYDSTSALTADGITVLTATGGGRWLRRHRAAARLARSKVLAP